ncbi:uncharacterized protein [Chelonus insularis]|uniref:uncharacterized protein n=1 Tax=Chelonus insularis TaxID=460826 RepID=UPI001588A926|nr:uncharacterized protein LOC118065538 [Chelonus insularis]
MYQNWHQDQTEDQRETMLKYVKISNLISIAGIITISINVVLYYSGSFFGLTLRTETNLTDIPGYTLAIQSSYFYDITKGRLYVLTRLSQVTFGIVGGMFNTTIDIIFSIFVLHTCGQLANIANSIKKVFLLFMEMYQNWYQDQTEDQRETMLKYVKISNLISKAGIITISTNIVIYNSGSFLGLTLRTETNLTDIPGYMLPIQSSYFYDITKGRLYVLTRLSQVIFCILGGMFNTTIDVIFSIFVLHTCGQLANIANSIKSINEVEFETFPTSERVHEALYDSDWCLLTPRVTQQLLMIFIRSQKSLTISVGKFAPLTLANFLQLMKSCGGYVSFLLAMND